MGKVDKEVVRIAAETGAKAAMDRWEKERVKTAKERVDQRLYNTMLLLKNYRLFAKHAENAVYQIEQLDENVFDILEMMERSRSDTLVDSIKNSVARTAALVKHIRVMLGLYEVFCNSSSKPEDARRWRVVHGRFIADVEKSVDELAEQECVTDRTIRRDVEESCEHLAALLFGIDGVRKR